MSEHPAENQIILRRYLDADGVVLEQIGGLWVYPDSGARAVPCVQQVIRESAWEIYSERQGA